MQGSRLGMAQSGQEALLRQGEGLSTAGPRGSLRKSHRIWLHIAGSISHSLTTREKHVAIQKPLNVLVKVVLELEQDC